MHPRPTLRRPLSTHVNAKQSKHAEVTCKTHSNVSNTYVLMARSYIPTSGRKTQSSGTNNCPTTPANKLSTSWLEFIMRCLQTTVNNTKLQKYKKTRLLHNYITSTEQQWLKSTSLFINVIAKCHNCSNELKLINTLAICNFIQTCECPENNLTHRDNTKH